MKLSPSFFLPRLLLFVGLLAGSVAVYAQTQAQEDAGNVQIKPDWETSPKLHSVQPEYAKEAAVILVDKRIHEYLPNAKDGLIVKVVNHRIIKVNNENGVEQFNKIFLPVGYDGVYLDISARVITASGKIIELPKDKIFDVEEDGRVYKKFALEGVESGCEIEYIAAQQKSLYFFGLEVFQYAAPCQLAEFSLIVPAHLVFDVKGYNGFTVGKDSIEGSLRIRTGVCRNIPEAETEKYAQPTAYFKNVQYKLSYNLSKEKDERLFTWDQLAQNVYTSYQTIEVGEMNAVNAYVKSMKIEEQTPEEKKIILLEDYLKNKVSINEEGIGEGADKIEQIIKTNVASHDGFSRLMVACMNALHINYQIVFPSKRNNLPLDKELENYRLVDDMILYFPNTGQFLEPTNITIRYPYIQPNWAATNGLFVQTNTSAGGQEISASFMTIPVQPYTKSSHDIDLSIRFNSTMDSVLMHTKQIFTGYGAWQFRPAFHLLPKDRVEEFTHEVIQSIAKSKVITNTKVQNTAMTDGLTNKPLIFEADIASADLIESAGNKILFKIGDVIGPQEQMYQEKPRQYPISMEYPHVLDRTIRFEIPKGYTIKNPQDLNINIVESNDGKSTMGFVSKYTIAGNILTVTLHEYYHRPEYPIEKFGIFQKVINAAADFNKVLLVLEKK
ncbi:MAG TPA: DUF3857 domain-containing protein [Phnomibacter sp.]|nr:DUF3857 domain-containing protein [Phnomibacter sp.]